MPFSANHEEMEFTEQLACFHKPIAVNSKREKPPTSVTLKKRNDNETQSKTQTTLGFFSNQNDLLVEETPIPVLFLISKAIIHHFKSQRDNQLRPKQKKSSDFFRQSFENRSIKDS